MQLAVPSAIAGRALTLETLTRVTATAAVQARLARARHRLRFAVLANPPVTTLTCVAVVIAAGIVGTCAVVHARVDAAIFDFNFAVGAQEAGRALACVRSLSGVGAGPAVVTRLVVGAEVEVLIAEQAAPALLADALPLHAAGSVHASWIHFTLVTIRSSVSALASVGDWKWEK